MILRSLIYTLIAPFLPDFIRHWLKLMIRKEYRITYFEHKRIKKLPRYQPANTILFNKSIKIVDSATFLGGYSEIIEKEVYRFNTSTETPYIIDCGANIGLSVIYFKRLLPNAEIVAFEPDPSIFNCLQNNIRSFGFDNIRVFHEAVWKEDTEIDFKPEGGYSRRIPMPGDVDKIIKVKARRLRNLLNRDVDFLKIDIEGAEYEVIKDCSDLLTNVKNIFIEYHSHAKVNQTLDEILSILKKSGFRYHIHHAFINHKPFIEKFTCVDMDMQLNIYGFR